MGGHGRAALSLAIAALLLAQGCSTSRGLEAMRVLSDLAAGDGPSALKAATPPPRRTPIAYRVEDRDYRGDLYQPGNGALAALVLVPGAARTGKDDPRLVAFANTLARARFAVLVPDLRGLRALRLRAADAGEIADAVSYLDTRPAAGREGVGIAAISYAAGPAVLAAVDPAVRDRVRFVLAIGGYYDIEAVLTFFTTGYYRERSDGPWRYRAPNALGKWMFVHSNADLLRDPMDRATLAEMARRKLDDLEAEIGDLVGRLGPEGRSVHALLVNRNPDRVPALLAGLPPAIRADLEALDLKRHDLSILKGPLILIHGRDDPIIPFSESVALAAALPEGRADLYLVDSLAHVDLGPTGFQDAVTLWRAVYRLLELREAAT